MKNKKGRFVERDKTLKYAKQFKKAAEDILSGKKESITLASSLGVIEIMDEIRKQIGVKYSCD